MYKNNSRFSSKFKGFSPLQLSCNLISLKSAIAYFGYTVVSNKPKIQSANKTSRYTKKDNLS